MQNQLGLLLWVTGVALLGGFVLLSVTLKLKKFSIQLHKVRGCLLSLDKLSNKYWELYEARFVKLEAPLSDTKQKLAALEKKSNNLAGKKRRKKH